MRTLPALLIGALAIGCGAEPTETEENAAPSENIGESALSLIHASDAKAAGTFTASVGNVAFSSVMVEQDVLEVKFELGGHVFTSHVDWVKMENDLSMTGTTEVTAADRALLRALTRKLEQEVGKDTQVSDNLARQAALWSSHPEGKLVISHVTPERARGWTTLCNGTSYRNFSHDASSHGLLSEYLKYGPGETTNPCRARCGPGCNGIGTSAWTVDCGNHDRCEQTHPSSDCADEFASASDDYTFAKNCSY